ncbi:hypothetical protein RJT34_19333 [Clitoria ternatea]|uniref:Uncharacterized protein n=1 Tax=Clitoria ternatea TaxID=43366 RepID=A0AAN9P4J1_CLITE
MANVARMLIIYNLCFHRSLDVQDANFPEATECIFRKLPRHRRGAKNIPINEEMSDPGPTTVLEMMV